MCYFFFCLLIPIYLQIHKRLVLLIQSSLYCNKDPDLQLDFVDIIKALNRLIPHPSL